MMTNFNDRRKPIPKEAEHAAIAGVAAICGKRGLSFRAGNWLDGARSFQADIDVPLNFTFWDIKALVSEVAFVLKQNIPCSNTHGIATWQISLRAEGKPAGGILGGLPEREQVEDRERDIELRQKRWLERPADERARIDREIEEIEANSVLKTPPVLAALEKITALCDREKLTFDAGFVEDDRFMIGINFQPDSTLKRAFAIAALAESLLSESVCSPGMRGYQRWSVSMRSGDWEIVLWPLGGVQL